MYTYPLKLTTALAPELLQKPQEGKYMKRIIWCVVFAFILLPSIGFGQGTQAPSKPAEQTATEQKKSEAARRAQQRREESRRKQAEILRRREEYASRGRFPYANPGQARLFPEVMKTQGQHAEINEITVAEIVNGSYGENAQKRLQLALALVGFAGNGEQLPGLPDAVWEEFKHNILTNRYKRTEFAGLDFDLRMVYGIPDNKGNITVKATSFPPEMIGFTIVGLKVDGILAETGPYAGKLIHFVIVTAFKFPGRTEVEVGCGNITGVLSEPLVAEPEPLPVTPHKAMPPPSFTTVTALKEWRDAKGRVINPPRGADKISFIATASDGQSFRAFLNKDGDRVEIPNVRLPERGELSLTLSEDASTQVKGFRSKTGNLVITLPQLDIATPVFINEKVPGKPCRIGPLPCWAVPIIAGAVGTGIYLATKDHDKKPEPAKRPQEPQKIGGPGPSPIVTGLSTGYSLTGASPGGITIRF